MNADTGALLELPPLTNWKDEPWWPEVGQPVTPSDLPSYDEAAGPEHAEAIRELRDAVYAEEPIVVVSEAVAVQVRLGGRELERRRRRRKAAKQARKRNR